MVDPSYEGTVFPAFTHTVERGKLNEFRLAIGDANPDYQTEDPPLPPTFATVFAFWGGMKMEGALGAMGVQMQNVLHGEQEYEYFTPIHIGDTITGQLRVSRIYQRAGMDFVELITDYANQHNTPVLRERALIIVRQPEGES
jgi:hypothetical protein